VHIMPVTSSATVPAELPVHIYSKPGTMSLVGPDGPAKVPNPATREVRPGYNGAGSYRRPPAVAVLARPGEGKVSAGRKGE